MKNIKKKDKVQKKALRAWLKADKCGSIEAITGVGKTFIFLHALYTMPRDDNVIHLFLAEVIDREKDLLKDIEKYNEIFNRNVLNDYNLEFYCYQTVYKWKNKKFGLVGCDEIHDQMTLTYSKFHKNNSYDAVIGLSATINRTTKYIMSNGNIITKGQILDKICPVCFKYGFKQAKKDKTTRKLQIIVIKNKLDNKIKYIKAGNKKKRFYQTELKNYEFWNNRFKQSLFIEDEIKREKMILINANKRSNIIYNSIQKINNTKKILKTLKDKTLIFSNSLDSLLKVTKNVVSSRNNNDKNDKIRKDFKNNKIKTIGSFKKLKQGANLDNLDNVILMSYYGTTLDIIQRAGRLRDNGKIGNLFILLTEDTQEQVWFSNMMENFKDHSILYYDSINEYLKNKK